MKTTTVLILATIAFAGSVILYTLTGCGGDGGNNRCTTMDCPDAGPMMTDANPLAPDADTTPDANPDVCADYRWMAEKPWDCHTSIPTTCDIELSPFDGVCGVHCVGIFWFKVNQLIISRVPPPPSFVVHLGEEPVTCYQHL